jgi:hypothetical protein
MRIWRTVSARWINPNRFAGGASRRFSDKLLM